jgi:hypothetical protein
MKRLLIPALLIFAGIAIAEDFQYVAPRPNDPLDASQEWQHFPYRAFDNQVVNLSSLIEWWVKASDIGPRTNYGSNYLSHLPERPLTAWNRIYGQKVGEDTYGWIVQGYVESAPGFIQEARFEVRHPPTRLTQPDAGLWPELDQFPSGSNCMIDLFATKIGYRKYSTNLEVFDLGQMRAKLIPSNP